MSHMKMRKRTEKKRSSATSDDENEAGSNLSDYNLNVIDLLEADDEEGYKKKKPKIEKVTLELAVSFGGRKVHNPDTGTDIYYESLSTGAVSDSVHARKQKFSLLHKDFRSVTFADDVLPLIEGVLLGLPVPVENNEVPTSLFRFLRVLLTILCFIQSLHLVARPVVYSDGSIAAALDEVSRAQIYHLLELVDMNEWKLTSQKAALSICVLPKILPDRPPLVAVPKGSKKTTSHAEVAADKLKVVVFHGGVKYQGNLFKSASLLTCSQSFNDSPPS